MNEYMWDNDTQKNETGFTARLHNTKVHSRQSHLIGKSDIPKGVLLLVRVLKTLLSCMCRAHCGNAFRISSSNSSSTKKSHALQAGIMSLVVDYTEMYNTAFVV